MYTVTVLDFHTDAILGIRRTPAVYTKWADADFTIRNNLQDLADGGTFQYGVIEESRLNMIRPNLECQRPRWWYKYNQIHNIFEPCAGLAPMRYQSGFGIG